ncbi:uncharacterized protein RJT20DRAFT_11657 [Scheffersomyces xylosifermentans]|uniref:uncharacterized protein n=1 Tax=Scheffersomyces xylosifermentans TaxID=1304137 RepID=UPI00315C9F4D
MKMSDLAEITSEPSFTQERRPCVYILCNNVMSRKITVLNSSGSMRGLLDWKKAAKKDAAISPISSDDIPVLEANTGTFGSNLKVVTFVCNGNQLEKKDYSDIIKKYHSKYFNYTFNLKDGSSFIMKRHRVLPILDFQYNNNIYRWIYTKPRATEYDFLYSLYKLESHQQTLFDEDEELLNTKTKGIFSISSKIPKSEYYGTHLIAQLEHKEKSYPFIRLMPTAELRIYDWAEIPRLIVVLLSTQLKYIADSKLDRERAWETMSR